MGGKIPKIQYHNLVGTFLHIYSTHCACHVAKKKTLFTFPAVAAAAIVLTRNRTSKINILSLLNGFHPALIAYYLLMPSPLGVGQKITT